MKDAVDILVEALFAEAIPAPEYPEDHQAAMRVPKGGSSCASCEYLGKDGESCTNKYFIKWHGSGKLPAPADEFCSDWYEPKIDIDAYGTSEGVKKAWDTRGRGRKPRPLGPPRMVNRIQRTRPHDPKSAIGQVMDMAQREQGVKVSEAKEFLKNAGINLWVISFVRKGEGNGFKWQIIDDGKKSGTIKIGKPEKISDQELQQKQETEAKTPEKLVGTPESHESHLATTPISGSEELGGGINPSRIIDFSDGTKAVFKPDPNWSSDKERTRQNIPLGQDTEREVGAWQVAKLVGMDDIVSPAIIKTIDGERGALLEWQDGDVAANVDRSDRYDGDKDAERAAMFDFVIGNEDRHSFNWVVSGEGDDAKLHLIDHGLSFPEKGYQSWHNAMFYDHVQFGKWADKPPNSEAVEKFVKAAPAITDALKKLDISDDAIKGVNRRIGILNDAEDWGQVNDDEVARGKGLA